MQLRRYRRIKLSTVLLQAESPLMLFDYLVQEPRYVSPCI